MTMTGPMGIECLRRLDARVAVPVHVEDCGAYKSGLDDFRRAVDAANMDVVVRYVGRRDSVKLE